MSRAPSQSLGAADPASSASATASCGLAGRGKVRGRFGARVLGNCGVFPCSSAAKVRKARTADISRADAGRAVDAMISTISNALKKGDSVTLVGFGTFDVRKRAARTGRNPRTGEEIKIAASTRESFTVDEVGTGLQYRFVLPGPQLSPSEQARCVEELGAVASTARFVVASGSLPPGVPVNFYQQIADLCGGLDVALILDTSGLVRRSRH